MAVKKSTRKTVNDPVIDSALRDIYTKIDKLLPSPPNEPYTNLTKKNFVSKNLKKIYDKFFNKKVLIRRLKNKTKIFNKKS